MNSTPPWRQTLLERGLKAPEEKTKKHSTGKTLECVMCQKRYSESDIAGSNYCLDTMVCHYCYKKMQDKPRTVCCFGKARQNLGFSGRQLPGYDEAARECRSLCPDRVYCRSIVMHTEIEI